MTAPSRVQCSAAPVWRDRHLAAADRQYHVTDPDGRQFVFCSGCCLLSYACYGALPADVEAAAASSGRSEGEVAA
jgi:hypothetical protein